MKKMIFVFSALMLGAALTFGQVQNNDKSKTETKTTVVKKETNNNAKAPIAHKTHMKKSSVAKRAKK